MVTYKFKLIDSRVPVMKGRTIIEDSNVGGIKNTYKLYYLRWNFFGYKFWNYVGTKTFLRPYQSVWDAKEHRLSPVYWGKGPFVNLWLVLSNNYNNLDDVKVLLPEGDTTHHCTKIFDIDFKSQEITKNLKLNQSFYQSKFEKHGSKK